MAALTVHRKEAKSKNTKSLVIFLHGYGADGADLLGLSESLAQYLPDTVFVAPDAARTCSINPAGFEWFPIPRMDGSSEEDSRAALDQSVIDINEMIDAQMAAEGVGADKTLLFGFSQGTMMSLQVAPRRSEELAGVVGFSGRLLDADKLAAETVTRPQILLAHGDQDPMVPYESLELAVEALTAADFDVFQHTSNGAGHTIAPDALRVALQFMRENLS